MNSRLGPLNSTAMSADGKSYFVIGQSCWNCCQLFFYFPFLILNFRKNLKVLIKFITQYTLHLHTTLALLMKRQELLSQDLSPFNRIFLHSMSESISLTVTKKLCSRFVPFTRAIRSLVSFISRISSGSLLSFSMSTFN